MRVKIFKATIIIDPIKELTKKLIKATEGKIEVPKSKNDN